MARGEKHGNREAKKPKQEKTKTPPTLSPFATPPGKTGSAGGQGAKK
jgi:hypothetical protein